jgi:TolB-like protein/DNA-binding winged helix-turn-helix (wHTH) protein/Tfp pilus assembly protein PilF
MFLAWSGNLGYNSPPDGFLDCRSGLPFARNTVPRCGLEVLPKFWKISGKILPERMNRQRKHFFAFGPFRFDPEERLLQRDGKPIPLGPKVTETLLLLVENAGHLVDKNDLIKQVWPDAFVEEGSLNKNIFVLRKALGQWDGGREYIETLPKRGYRFVAPVNQSVEEDSAPQPPVGAKTALSRRVQWLRTGKAMGIFLLVVLAVFAIWRTTWNRRAQSVPSDVPTIHSLAVLPLENLSGNPSEDYFADGMTDELITTLGQIRSLRVISRTSVLQYRGIHKTLPQIGRELKVDAIVEGTVVRSGERVRITAQLIQASGDKHLWAQSYESDLKDVLVLQREIASAIAKQIRITLTAYEQIIPVDIEHPINVEAYESYLKGEYFLNRFTADSVHKAADSFQKAIEQDPNFVPAYTKLAGSYEILGNMGAIPKGVNHPKATLLVAKALELDPEFAAAHAVRGWGLLQYDLDFATAGAEFKRAVELNPSGVEGHEGLADYYATVGQVQQAVQEMERAREVDPLGLIVNNDLCLMLYFARRYDAAIAQCKATLDLEPRSAVTLWQLGSIYAARGMDSEAASAFIQAEELWGIPPAMIAAFKSAKKDSGLGEHFKASLQFLGEDIDGGEKDPFSAAVAYTYAGNTDKALTWLERAFEARAYGITYMGVDPTFDRLRSDPRFVLLLRRIGLPAAQY